MKGAFWYYPSKCERNFVLGKLDFGNISAEFYYFQTVSWGQFLAEIIV